MEQKSDSKAKKMILCALLGLLPLSLSHADSACTLLPVANYQTPFCQNQYQKIIHFTPHVFNTQNQNVIPGQTLGGIIGIYRHINNGEQTCYISCGLQRLNGEAPNENTMFELASVTKTFTGAVLGTLVHKRLLKPSNLASTLLPSNFSLTANEAPVTLEQLVTFSGGVCFSNPPDVNIHSGNPILNQKNYVRAINRLDPSFPYCLGEQRLGANPRSIYQTTLLPTQNHYSNSSLGLLAQALMNYEGFPDALEGSFNGWICSNITNPLEMNSTNACLPKQAKNGTCPTKTTVNGTPCNTHNWKNAQYAMGYHLNNQHYQQGAPFPFIPWAGAGALRSNASDMIKYIRANLGIRTNNNPKQIDLIQGMQIAHAANKYLPSPINQPAKWNIGNQFPIKGGQGYAWVCEIINNDRICGKIGGHINFRSFIGISTKKQYGVIVLFNTGANGRSKVPTVSEIGVNLIKNY
ncbi:MAG: serine hydrolase domain-containing protein [Legionella sp.]|uniref:serine hydrolase domain-containing protein n=1 Tax=Legionella sp. TaxID=459 RepID=UPI0039E3CA92